eukprot:c1011_g1_i1 orf=194-3067(+)
MGVLLRKRGLISLKLAGRFFYFLFLILCIPVVVKDDGLKEHQERPRFLCKQSGSDGHSDSSVILESFVAKDPSMTETLNKTLWALKFDREVWHGELLDMQNGELTSNVSLLPPVGQSRNHWSEGKNETKSAHALVSPAAEKVGKDGESMLVMHCDLRHLDIESPGYNHSISDESLQISQAQSSLITIAKDVLFGKVLILASPDVFHPMVFHLHDQCAWTNQGYKRSAILSFFDERKAVRTLELDLNSSLSHSLKQKTFKEHVSRLLDERSAMYVCNQGTSKEFTVKNTRSSPLQVYSLMIQGVNGATHGFKVDLFGGFHLGPGQSIKMLVSYLPDFKTGITEGDLQLITSAGMLSVTLRANVPKNVQSFCHNAALFARARKFFLQVCSLALCLVLLVFGRMLKQENSIMSDVSQWSSPSNAAKTSQGSHGKSMQCQDDKKSSIYLSIDFGCTHNESRQCGKLLSFTKALDVIHAATSSIVSLKLLHVSQAANAQQPVISITGKNDVHTKQSNNPTSPTNMAGKKKSSTHPRACNKLPSITTNSGGGASPCQSKASSKESTIPQLDGTRLLVRTEPESPTSVLSDKEKEKVKQKRRRKGVASLVMENGSDSGSSSPLSMPSSPVTQDVTCRSVSPLCSSLRTPFQNRRAPLDVDATMSIPPDNNGRKASRWHCCTDSSLPIAGKTSSEATGSKLCLGDKAFLEAKKTRDFSESLSQEDISLEPTLPAKRSEKNLLKATAMRNSTKGNETIRGRSATLTVSATFPAPGQRSLQEGVHMVQEDGQKWSMVASSSSLDLVSTSMVAPHARAPGSPLSPKAPLSSSLFTAPSNRHQHKQQSSRMRTSRRTQEGGVEDEAFQSQHNERIHERPYHSGAMRSSGYFPYQIHESHYAQKRKDPQHGSEAVILYDIWGDHFADLGRRWGPYWVAKDAPISRKPSSLPPLLQTPAFSIFSSNDLFTG